MLTPRFNGCWGDLSLLAAMSAFQETCVSHTHTLSLSLSLSLSQMLNANTPVITIELQMYYYDVDLQRHLQYKLFQNESHVM